jgi:hypothetical protein
MSTNETIILAFEQHNRDITIRIDKNGLAQSSFVGLPVVELQLLGVSDPDRVMDELAVDLSLDYEINEKPGEPNVLMCINYSPDDFEVKCSSVREIESDYTVEDLKSKTSWLAERYLQADTENRLNVYMYFLLKETLTKKIARELDNYQRKIEFFERTDKEKAANITGQAQAYRKVLALIGLGELDGQPIASEISKWFSRIWDDRIEYQVAYSQAVEKKISDLGSAALFPLLEMIRRCVRGYERKKLIHFLGIVDRVVESKISLILPSDDSL